MLSCHFMERTDGVSSHHAYYLHPSHESSSIHTFEFQEMKEQQQEELHHQQQQQQQLRLQEFSEDQDTPLKKGPWTAEEDALLLAYVSRHGDGNWNTVQKYSGVFRNGKSCRLRWTNHLRPNLKKGAFSPEEERIIIEQHAAIGNRWSRIAAMLPGRTDNEIKNFWNTRKKRRSRAGLPLYPASVLLRPVSAAGNNTTSTTVGSPPESIITSLQSLQPERDKDANVASSSCCERLKSVDFHLKSSSDLFNPNLRAEAQSSIGRTLITHGLKRVRGGAQHYAPFQILPPVHQIVGHRHDQDSIPMDSSSLHQVVLPEPPDMTMNGYGDSLSFSTGGGNETCRSEERNPPPSENTISKTSSELPSVQSTESADSSSGLSTSFRITYPMLSISEVDSFDGAATSVETLGGTSGDGNLLDVVLQRCPEIHQPRGVKIDGHGVTEPAQQEEVQTPRAYCRSSPRPLAQVDTDPLSFLGGRSLTLLGDDPKTTTISEGDRRELSESLAAGEEFDLLADHKPKELTSSLTNHHEEDDLLTLLAFGRLDSMSFSDLYEEQGRSVSDAASMDRDDREELMNGVEGMERCSMDVGNLLGGAAVEDDDDSRWEQLDSCLLWNNMPGAMEAGMVIYYM